MILNVNLFLVFAIFQKYVQCKRQDIKVMIKKMVERFLSDKLFAIFASHLKGVPILIQNFELKEAEIIPIEPRTGNAV